MEGIIAYAIIIGAAVICILVLFAVLRKNKYIKPTRHSVRSIDGNFTVRGINPEQTNAIVFTAGRAV